MRERLAKAEGLVNTANAEAKTANQHYNAFASRLEAAAREIESLKKPKTTAAKKTAKLAATTKVDQ